MVETSKRYGAEVEYLDGVRLKGTAVVLFCFVLRLKGRHDAEVKMVS